MWRDFKLYTKGRRSTQPTEEPLERENPGTMKERQYSFQTGHRNSFGVTDIVIFVVTLGFSAGIGVFYAIKVRETYFQFFLVDNIATFLLLLLKYF